MCKLECLNLLIARSRTSDINECKSYGEVVKGKIGVKSLEELIVYVLRYDKFDGVFNLQKEFN